MIAAEEGEAQSLAAAIRRAEAAEARTRILEAENGELRAERTNAIMAAARAESAAAASGEGGAARTEERLTALSEELHAAQSAARALETSFRRELADRLDAMRQSHSAELEARAEEAKRRFAEELMSAMSNAVWRASR